MQTKNNQSIRTCLYCNKQFNKQDLIRLVKVNNKLVIDLKHNMSGRGYYLKLTDQALKDPRLLSILSKKTRTSINNELLNQFKQMIK